MAANEGEGIKRDLVNLSQDASKQAVPLIPCNAIKICDILKNSGFSTADWESLAPRLGVTDTKSIWTIHPRDPFLCLYDVICQWLQSDPQASWEKLAAEVSKAEGYGLNTAQTILAGASIAPRAPLPQSISQAPECIVEYGKLLKNQYQMMSVLPSTRGDWPPSLGRQFTNLTIIKRQRLPDAKQAKSLEVDYIHGRVENITAREKVVEDVTELFESDETQVKVLLDGAPGIGKTTLSRKACKDWADGTKLHKYILVVFLSLREKRVKEAKCVEDLFRADNPKLQQQVVQYVQETSGEHLLLILDGYDELNCEEGCLILDIIERKQLQKCSVLVTSRPYASDDLQELECIDHHIEVVGFTKMQIQECIKQNIQDEAKATELVILLKEKSDITTLCYTPLNTAILLYVYKQEQCTLPNTLTKLFEMFVLNALKRHTKQNDFKLHKRVRTLSTLPPPLNHQMHALSNMAYQGMLARKLVFQEEELEQIFSGCSDWESNLLGLMTAVKSYSGTGEETNYQFLHLNIQEFLAARHIAVYFTKQEQAEFIRKNLKNNQFRMMLLFLAGMSPLSTDSAKVIFLSRNIDLPRYPYIDAKCHCDAPVIEYRTRSCFSPALPRIVSASSFGARSASGLFSAEGGTVNKLKILQRISTRDYNVTVQVFLLLLHIIYESQNFSLFQILISTLSNQHHLFFQFHWFTPSDCKVLGQFLSQAKHSWETLEFHFCGLTDQSLETFHRACSEKQNKDHTVIKEVTLSYNQPSFITKLSLLSGISWLKCTERLIIQGIQYSAGVPAKQIKLHSIMDLQNLTDLTLTIRRIPEEHISDYGEALSHFMAAVVCNKKLERLSYTGPLPPN